MTKFRVVRTIRASVEFEAKHEAEAYEKATELNLGDFEIDDENDTVYMADDEDEDSDDD